MKKFCLIVLLVFLFSLPALSSDYSYPIGGKESTSLTNNGNGITLNFRIPEYSTDIAFKDACQYDVYSIASENTMSIPGVPALPYISRLILVPMDGEVEVEVTSIQSEIKGDVQPFIYTDEDDQEAAAGLGKSSYLECAGFWPPEPVVLSEPGIMRGYRLAKVTLFPFQYNRTTGEMRINQEMDVNVSFTGSQPSLPSRKYQTGTFQRLINSLVANPPELHRDDYVQNGSVVYVTSQNEDIIEEVSRLVEWRRRKGQTAEIICLNRPNDVATIKQAIQDAYDEWDIPPEFIVLVGNGRNNDNFPMACFDERDGAAYRYETDHHFGELDGEDILPEAAVGRIVFANIENLNAIVDKIIQYESEPYLGEDEEAGWQQRGAVLATDNRSGLSCIDMSLWTRRVLLDNGFDSVDQLYYNQNNPEVNPTQFIMSNISDGINYMTYRGWCWMNGFDQGNIYNMQNRRMLPFVVLATCNTGDYGESQFGITWSELFLMNADGGAIGCVGAAGATHTPYNNLIVAGITRGIFIEGFTQQGWALMRGKLDLYRNYFDRGDIDHPENQGESWLVSTYIYNLMGDPATDLFTAVPKSIIVDHADEVIEGSSSFTAHVVLVEGEEPVEGIQVCLYCPDVFQLVELTDENGDVTFGFNPELLEDQETVMLTVTGHNYMSYLADLDVITPNDFVGSASWEIQDGDDEVANPGELLDLTVEIMNYGRNEPEGQLTATLTSTDPNLEVTEGDFEADEAPAPHNSVFAEYLVRIGGEFPNGKSARFNLTVQVGEATWESAVNIPVAGAKFTLEQIEWNEDPLEPGEAADLRIEVRNIGHANSPAFTANLVSLTRTVEVLFGDAAYDEIPVGETGMNGQEFRLSAHAMHLPGSDADFVLELEAENGWHDEFKFSIPVGTIEDGDPFGPDEYGYACFDDTDEDWFESIEFDWIEIDPNEDGLGEDTEISDIGEENDESILVDLPFNFTYYGEDFNQVTICSNGWMAMGNQTHVFTARNRRIPSGMVASGMICPYWDDLVTDRDAGVYIWFDEERHLFIVEWSKVRSLTPDGNPGPYTFEVILYDPEFHPSITGDGDIVFQYLAIEDTRQCFHWDTPFGTVGIASPDMLDGLEYSYWNELHAGAAPLEAERAIKFTTNVGNFEWGNVAGVVLSGEDNSPLMDVQISSNYGNFALTDEDGEYILENVISDPLFPVNITAYKEYWSPEIIENVEILPNETIQLPIILVRPHMAINPEELSFNVFPDSMRTMNINIHNDGQGDLHYRSKIIPYQANMFNQSGRDDNDDMWDCIQSFDVSEVTEDFRINGIVWCEEVWVVSGSSVDEDICRFYMFDRSGEFIQSIVQPEIPESMYGIKDMEYYDGYLYGALSENYLVKIDIKTGEYTRLPLPENVRTISCLTIDPVNGLFYVASITSDLFELQLQDDDTFIRTDAFDIRNPVSGENLRRYGLGWEPSATDGFHLYIICNYDRHASEETPDISLYKMNPETEEIRFVRGFEDLDPNLQGKCGMSISTGWNFMTTIFATVFDHPDGDWAYVYELGLNSSWIDYNSDLNTVAGGMSENIPITFHTADFDTGRYEIALEFTHDAEPGRTMVPIFMHVTTEFDDINEDNPDLPTEWALNQNYPNPFNPSTDITFTLKKAIHTQLKVYDVSGRLVDGLIDQEMEAGNHTILFNADRLPGGIYFYRLDAGDYSCTRKMVLIK